MQQVYMGTQSASPIRYRLEYKTSCWGTFVLSTQLITIIIIASIQYMICDILNHNIYRLPFKGKIFEFDLIKIFPELLNWGKAVNDGGLVFLALMSIILCIFPVKERMMRFIVGGLLITVPLVMMLIGLLNYSHYVYALPLPLTCGIFISVGITYMYPAQNALSYSGAPKYAKLVPVIEQPWQPQSMMYVQQPLAAIHQPIYSPGVSPYHEQPPSYTPTMSPYSQQQSMPEEMRFSKEPSMPSDSPIAGSIVGEKC
jgi:hypothetical protein